MNKLRKEKRKLELQISQEKAEIISEVEKYKNSLWPFRIVNNFRKTIDSLSENKLIVLGAQLAYAAMNTKHEKKTESSGDEKADVKTNVVEFLKNTAKKFLENYVKTEDSSEEEKN